jgi:thymidylate synthase
MIYRNVTEGLRDLCAQVMTHGAEVPSRAGLTKELTHVHVELTHPLEREITLQGRGHSLPAQIAETMWVLAGRNDVEFLGHYLPRSPDFSDDSKVWRAGYGPRIRAFQDLQGTIDQLGFVVDLLNQDRGTRRAVMSIWDPRVDTQPGKDIPCNDWLHFLPRDGRLDLHVAVRSNDLIWGWSGINHFEWSVLLEVVARLTGFEVGSLHFSISSLHIYEQHWGKADRLKIAPAGPSHKTPRFNLARFTPRPDMNAYGLRYFDQAVAAWFRCEEMIRSGQKVPIAEMPNDPLFCYWLDVLGEHWAKKRAETPADPFADKVTALHDQKHAAYGDSWMKRGELFSIIPNIARKVDRLASGKDTDDETQADTAQDLLVYLAKYRCWLTEFANAPAPDGYTSERVLTSETTYAANELIRAVKPAEGHAPYTLARLLEIKFEALLAEVEEKDSMRYTTVEEMLPLASALARSYA